MSPEISTRRLWWHGAAIGILLLTGCTSTEPSEPVLVLVGEWGGDSLAVIADSHSVTLVRPCYRGSGATPLTAGPDSIVSATVVMAPKYGGGGGGREVIVGGRVEATRWSLQLRSPGGEPSRPYELTLNGPADTAGICIA